MTEVIRISKDGQYRICVNRDGEPTLQILKDGKWRVKEHLGQRLNGRPQTVKAIFEGICKKYDM